MNIPCYLTKYKILEPKISWSKVKKIFIETCDIKEEKNNWTFSILKKANREYSKWIHLQLILSDADEIILPWHNHHNKNNGINLVPPQGLSLFQVSSNLREKESVFVKQMPACIEKIKYFNNKPIGIVYLVAGTLQIDLHKYLEYSENKFVNIDGLHRLLSLHYPEERKDTILECYVAYNKRKKIFMSLLYNYFNHNWTRRNKKLELNILPKS